MQTSKYYLAQNVKNIEVDKTAEVERQAHGQNNPLLSTLDMLQKSMSLHEQS